jgi:hypothetical protein
MSAARVALDSCRITWDAREVAARSLAAGVLVIDQAAVDRRRHHSLFAGNEAVPFSEARWEPRRSRQTVLEVLGRSVAGIVNARTF